MADRKRELLRNCDEARDAVAEACRKFAEANERRAADYDTVLTPAEQLALGYLRSQLRILDLNLNELHYVNT